MLSIIESLALLREAKTTSVDLIAKAKEAAQNHAVLNAIAWVDWELAEQTAKTMDDQRRASAGGREIPLGHLHGIPITIKDLYHYQQNLQL